MSTGELPIAREMPPLRVVASRIYGVLIRLSRRLPRLIWYGDEVDVLVVFTADKLPRIEGDSMEAALGEALREFNSSPVREAEAALSRLGVEFDTGMGSEGKDWEWDFSLRGPISVRFKRRAQRPERRAGAKQKGRQ